MIKRKPVQVTYTLIKFSAKRHGGKKHGNTDGMKIPVLGSSGTKKEMVIT